MKETASVPDSVESLAARRQQVQEIACLRAQSRGSLPLGVDDDPVLHQAKFSGLPGHHDPGQCFDRFSRSEHEDNWRAALRSW
jgi:hypothetical protein